MQLGRLKMAVAVLTFALVGEVSAKPAAVQPEARMFHLGQLEVVALRDADNIVANDGKTFGVGVDPKAVASVLTGAGAPADPITLSVDALLVQGQGRVMLFDTGLGPPAHGVLLESLARAGVTPEQVTDVFITHSHPDHIGGLVTPDGRPAFPRAVIHMSAEEWAFSKDGGRSTGVVTAIASQVQPFEPGATVAGVQTVALTGHTPGHTAYRIRSQGRSLFDMGDSAHSAIISLARPEWTIQYDADADAGRANRQATLARLADTHELVFAPHFPFPGVGRVVKAAQGYTWAPATDLK